MDSLRFDRFSRSLATRSTRRQAAGGAGMLGLLALLFDRSPAFARADEVVTCRYDFTATVNVPAAAKGQKPAEITGILSLPIAADGAIEAGTVVHANGETSEVAGQATGQS